MKATDMSNMSLAVIFRVVHAGFGVFDGA